MKQKILNIVGYFFFETGDCWIQRLSDKIYHTGFKAQANKTTADEIQKSDEKILYLYNKSRKN
jgi:hypothetical protein